MGRNNRTTVKSHRREQKSKRSKSPSGGQLAFVYAMNPRFDERSVS